MECYPTPPNSRFISETANAEPSLAPKPGSSEPEERHCEHGTHISQYCPVHECAWSKRDREPAQNLTERSDLSALAPEKREILPNSKSAQSEPECPACVFDGCWCVKRNVKPAQSEGREWALIVRGSHSDESTWHWEVLGSKAIEFHDDVAVIEKSAYDALKAEQLAHLQLIGGQADEIEKLRAERDQYKIDMEIADVQRHELLHLTRFWRKQKETLFRILRRQRAELASAQEMRQMIESNRNQLREDKAAALAEVARLGREVEELMKMDYWQDRYTIAMKSSDKFKIALEKVLEEETLEGAKVVAKLALGLI